MIELPPKVRAGDLIRAETINMLIDAVRRSMPISSNSVRVSHTMGGSLIEANQQSQPNEAEDDGSYFDFKLAMRLNNGEGDYEPSIFLTVSGNDNTDNSVVCNGKGAVLFINKSPIYLAETLQNNGADTSCKWYRINPSRIGSAGVTSVFVHILTSITYNNETGAFTNEDYRYCIDVGGGSYPSDWGNIRSQVSETTNTDVNHYTFRVGSFFAEGGTVTVNAQEQFGKILINNKSAIGRNGATGATGATGKSGELSTGDKKFLEEVAESTNAAAGAAAISAQSAAQSASQAASTASGLTGAVGVAVLSAQEAATNANQAAANANAAANGVGSATQAATQAASRANTAASTAEAAATTATNAAQAAVDAAGDALDAADSASQAAANANAAASEIEGATDAANQAAADANQAAENANNAADAANQAAADANQAAEDATTSTGQITSDVNELSNWFEILFQSLSFFTDDIYSILDLINKNNASKDIVEPNVTFLDQVVTIGDTQPVKTQTELGTYHFKLEFSDESLTFGMFKTLEQWDFKVRSIVDSSSGVAKTTYYQYDTRQTSWDGAFFNELWNARITSSSGRQSDGYLDALPIVGQQTTPIGSSSYARVTYSR